MVSTYILLSLSSAILFAIPAAPLPIPTPQEDPSARPPLTLKAQMSNFSFDLTENMPRSSSTLTPLDTLPSNCISYTTGKAPECTAGMTATNVTFDDCGDPWTICRCSDAQMSLDTIVDRFARVPVGLRRYVTTVVISADQTPHAYTLTNGDIHMFADCEMETWLHESTHAYDYASGIPHSGSQEWLGAIANDTCAPDDYSLNNVVEDFAQVSVLKIYALTHGGTLPPGFDHECMKNQLHVMDTLPLFNADTLFGNTCEIYDGNDGWDLDLSSKHNVGPPALKSKTYPLPYLDPPTSSSSGLQKKPMSIIDTAELATATKAWTPIASDKTENVAISISMRPETITLLSILLAMVIYVQ